MKAGSPKAQNLASPTPHLDSKSLSPMTQRTPYQGPREGRPEGCHSLGVYWHTDGAAPQVNCLLAFLLTVNEIITFAQVVKKKQLRT